LLDGGAYGGVWQRTGLTFKVLSAPVNAAQPTCRFFTTAFAPRSSHFYTPYAAECATVRANAAWQFESFAFYLQLPDAAGACAAGTEPLYRLYNNGAGGAPNHRYTRDGTVSSRMQHGGWTFEGDARSGAFACVPVDPIGSTVQGIWHATTDAGSMLHGVVLSDDTFYLFYTAPGTGTVAGVYQGGMLSVLFESVSTQARDFVIGAPARDVRFGGSFLARGPWTGQIWRDGVIVDRFIARYDAAYEQPATLASLAAAYAGSMGSSRGSQAAVVTVSATGNIAGTAAGCAFQGSVAPHGDVGVYEVALTLSGGLPLPGDRDRHRLFRSDHPHDLRRGAERRALGRAGFLGCPLAGTPSVADEGP